MGIAVVIATRMPMAEQTRLILAGLIVPTLWAIGIGWMVCQRRLGGIGLTMLPAPNGPPKKRSDRCQRANAPGSMREVTWGLDRETHFVIEATMANLSVHSSDIDLVGHFAMLFDLEAIGRDRFRAVPIPGATGRCFGGLLVAQAFNAAQRTVHGKIAHNLHAHFLRPGSEAEPLILQVEREFDGRSFATRRVIALQDDEPVIILTASFHLLEAGLEHAAVMPSVPEPETLLPLDALAREYGDSITDTARAYLELRSAFEMRPVGYPSFLQKGKDAPLSRTWFRLRAPIDADEDLGRVMLAYFSDYALLSSALIPHGINMFETSMQTASLDHAVWFHDEAPLDDWLLYATESTWAGRGRGRASGAIYTRNGRLVASTVQEGLIRLRPDRPAGGTIPHTP